MPGAMPGQIAKGHILKRIDETLNDLSPGGGRALFLSRLKAQNPDGSPTESLLTILGDPALFGLRRKDIKHLEKDWFNDNQVDGRRRSFWPSQQPIEPLLRHGMTLAIETANTYASSALPMDVYWICAGDSFEVTTCVGSAQATTLIITSRPEMSDRFPSAFEDRTDLEPIFTARPTKRGPGEDEIRLTQDYVEFVRPKAESAGPS
ncbi:MAG: hypothetical protein GY725_05925 [bacterium]|nr:hypothetical protein [bacterium]